MGSQWTLLYTSELNGTTSLNHYNQLHQIQQVTPTTNLSWVKCLPGGRGRHAPYLPGSTAGSRAQLTHVHGCAIVINPLPTVSSQRDGPMGVPGTPHG